MDSGTLADIVVFFHFLYVLFAVLGEIMIILGGFLHWRWIRNYIFRIIHLASALFVAFEVLIGMVCPLTELEWTLRQSAGQNVDTKISFVGRIIRKIIFYDLPPSFFIILYVTFALLVILSFILIPPASSRHSSRKPSNSKSSD